MSDKACYDRVPLAEEESSLRHSTESESENGLYSQLMSRPSRSSVWIRRAISLLYPILLVLAISSGLLSIVALTRLPPPENLCLPPPASTYLPGEQPHAKAQQAPQAQHTPSLSSVSASLDGNTLPTKKNKKHKKHAQT